MRVYKIREVRRYTGLTRKQIYDYEKSIPPIGTENEAGYKLYDQEGLEKLSLAALFAELGAGPQRINDIFSSRKYDKNKVLDDLIIEAKREKEHLEDVITVAEYLSMFNPIEVGFNMFQLRDLHQCAVEIRAEMGSDDIQNAMQRLDDETFNSLMDIYKQFGRYEESTDFDEEQDQIDVYISEIKDFASTVLGLKNSSRYVFSQALALSSSENYRKLVDALTRPGLSDIASTALYNNLFNHLFNELEERDDDDEAWELLQKRQFESDKVKQLIDELYTSSHKWLGIEGLQELKMALEGFRIGSEQDEERNEDNDDLESVIGLLIDAVQYYTDLNAL